MLLATFALEKERYMYRRTKRRRNACTNPCVCENWRIQSYPRIARFVLIVQVVDGLRIACMLITIWSYLPAGLTSARPRARAHARSLSDKFELCGNEMRPTFVCGQPFFSFREEQDEIDSTDVRRQEPVTSIAQKLLPRYRPKANRI